MSTDVDLTAAPRVADHPAVLTSSDRRCPRPDQLLDALADGLVAVDPALRISWTNAAGAALLGVSDPLGLPLVEVVGGTGDGDRLSQACLHVLSTGDPMPFGVLESALVSPASGAVLDCEILPVLEGGADGDALGVLLSLRDAAAAAPSGALRAALHQAEHDALTGLHNRHYLARIGGRRAADGRSVLFLDVDGFKAVNDEHGHAVGDHVIQEVGMVLRSVIRRDDHLVRIGGDEFVVVLDSCPVDRATVIAGELVAAVAGHDFRGGDEIVHLGLSAGVAGQTEPGNDGLDDAIRRADLACYAAKHIGRAQVAVDEGGPTAAAGPSGGPPGLRATGEPADPGGRPPEIRGQAPQFRPHRRRSTALASAPRTRDQVGDTMKDTTAQDAPAGAGTSLVSLVVVAEIALVRVSMASLMAAATGVSVAAAVSPDELPDYLAERTDGQCDAVILGLTSDSGHATVQQVASTVKAIHPAPALLVIGPRRDGLARTLLENGPERVAFLLDSNVTDADTLAHITRTVLRGVTAFDPAIVASVDGRSTHDGLGRLTPRERQVLEALSRGLTNASIAAELGITVKSVEANVTKVFRKLDLADGGRFDRRVLAALAFRS